MEHERCNEQRAVQDNAVQVSYDFSSSSHTSYTILTQYKDTIINIINREALLMNNSVKWFLAIHVSFKN